MRDALTFFKNIAYRCTGGIAGASLAVLFYLIIAFVYALYSKEKSLGGDIGIPNFIPEKQYLIPGVSITLSVGFLLGAYLAHCIDTSDDSRPRQTRRRPIAMPAAPTAEDLAESWIPHERRSNSDDESPRNQVVV